MYLLGHPCILSLHEPFHPVTRKTVRKNVITKNEDRDLGQIQRRHTEGRPLEVIDVEATSDSADDTADCGPEDDRQYRYSEQLEYQMRLVHGPNVDEYGRE